MSKLSQWCVLWPGLEWVCGGNGLEMVSREVYISRAGRVRDKLSTERQSIREVASPDTLHLPTILDPPSRVQQGRY